MKNNSVILSSIVLVLLLFCSPSFSDFSKSTDAHLSFNLENFGSATGAGETPEEAFFNAMSQIPNNATIYRYRQTIFYS